MITFQAGGFDKLTLDSLYEEAAYRNQQQQQLYEAPSPNPFMVANPSAMSPAVQMASMAQQQQQMFSIGAALNPFGDDVGFGTFPVDNLHHQKNNNPFGNPQV